MLCACIITTTCVTGFLTGLALLHAATTTDSPDENISQDFKKDEALWITDHVEKIKRITQTGKVDRYTDAMLEDGIHFKTGKTATLSADIVPGNYHSGGLIGVHGKGTHIIYEGKWKADEGGSYPSLVLRDGGKMTWSEKAHVDFVMNPNFFTRQIWVWGDGTGTLELAEGFVSDRTKGATVSDAMGTIRLAGLTLVTHHSQSLPYNSRPDGRGGIYYNGHVVFEGKTPSTWSIQTNPHRYGAQIDFATDGTIDCQAPLTHNGQINVCLPVGNGGHFTSTGAFRTTSSNVTITKTGPAMLSLEGQQAYEPGAKLIVEEGLLRLHTDPAESSRLGGKYGNNLHLVVKKGAKLVLASPRVRLAALTVEEGATVWQLDGVTLEVKGEKKVAEGATWVNGDK